MSLAMYAAPFDDEPNLIKNNENIINKKKVSNNKTQKRYGNLNSNEEKTHSEKVQTVLQTIHNTASNSSELADFIPMPPPESAGVQSTIYRESYKQNDNSTNDNLNTKLLTDSNDSNEMNSSRYSPYSGTSSSSENEDYYRRFIPNYEELYKNNLNTSVSGYSNNSQNQTNKSYSSNSQNEVLIDKLNYMIHLLEEQQDERTNSVVEEVILYSFLGIFIIFVIDSFARVGKYTR
jgi:hypothetical protein